MSVMAALAWQAAARRAIISIVAGGITVWIWQAIWEETAIQTAA
jgi:hypothetical protein